MSVVVIIPVGVVMAVSGYETSLEIFMDVVSPPSSPLSSPPPAQATTVTHHPLPPTRSAATRSRITPSP